MEITRLRHAYPEKAGFLIDRKEGYPEYTFLHFYNSVELHFGEQVIHTQPHAVILYDIGTPQYFKSDGPLIHDWLHFTGPIPSLLGAIKMDTVYYTSSTDFITHLIREMESEFYGDLYEKETILQIKCRELFVRLNRAVEKKATSELSKGQMEPLRYLRGAMFSSLEHPWTVEEMAKTVNMSASRLYPVYKKVYGISPMADLINARMDSAKNRLLFTREKVEEIAWSLGYQNVTHFIRQFKKAVGVTPAVYRKK